MIKKILKPCIVAVVVVFVALTLSSTAYAATDESYFTFSNGTITGLTQPLSGAVEIPSTIGGGTVKAIGASAFNNAYGRSVTSITIPSGVTTIGNSAFANCTSLTSVSIPSTVTSLGTSAFSGCTALTSVSIPSSITSIPNNCFYNCTKLASVSLPSTITSIGSSAFYYCSKLNSITLPTACTTLGASSFYYSGLTSIDLTNVKVIGSSALRETKLTTVTFPSTLTSVGGYVCYNCDSLTTVNWKTSLGVPTYAFGSCNALTTATLNNSVTSIGTYGFYDCTKLTTINLPSSLVTIDNYAFHNCQVLSQASLSFPDTLVTIGTSAFYNCDKITSIIIPNSVKTIRDLAFRNCSALTTVTIGSGVTSMYGNMFYEDSDITSVTLNSANTTYVQDSNGTIYNKAKTRLVYYLRSNTATSFTIPSTVTVIGSGAFMYNYNLRTVNIHSGVTSIESYNFVTMTKLTSADLPEGLKTIGSVVFWNCDSLTSMVIPSTVTSVGHAFCTASDGISYIDVDEANKHYESVEGVLYTEDLSKLIACPAGYDGDLTVMPGCTTIGNSAFRYCTKLTNVILPTGLTTIESYAFADCQGLTNIQLPETVTSLGSYAFYNCDYLTYIKLPSSITSIPSYCFYDCDRLENVDLPINLKTVGAYTFYHCDSLEFVEVPQSVKSIGTLAFGSTPSLDTLTVNSTSVSGSPWGASTSVTDVTSGTPSDYFTYSGSKVTGFSSTYYNLENKPRQITLPGFNPSTGAVITSVSDEAFSPSATKNSGHEDDYNNIISVSTYFKTGINFGKSSFKDCASLQKITYGSYAASYGNLTGVTFTIGDSAFENCVSLVDADWLLENASGNMTSIGKKAFYNCLLLDFSSMSSTITDIGLQAFYNCISLSTVKTNGTKLTSIGPGAFQNCKGLTRFDYSASTGVTSVEAITFKNCEKLITAKTPSSIKTIGEHAFDGCTSLTTLTCMTSTGAALNSIGEYAFHDCESLVKVYIPTTVTSIPAGCFAHCSALRTVDIPSTLTSIGEYAFEGCSSLISSGNEDETFPNYPATDTFEGFRGFTQGFKVPDGVTTIEAFSFADCTSLQNMYIPNTVTTISPYILGHEDENDATSDVIALSGAYTAEHDNGFTIYIDHYSHGITDTSTTNEPWGAGSLTSVVWLRELHEPYSLVPPYTDGNTEYRGVDYPQTNLVAYGAEIQLYTENTDASIVYTQATSLNKSIKIENKNYSGRTSYTSGVPIYRDGFLVAITEAYNICYSDRMTQYYVTMAPNAPQLTPSNASVPDNTTLTMFCDSNLNPGSNSEETVIYYTIDGTDPLTSSTRKVYSSTSKPVLSVADADLITRELTVRAVAVQGEARLGSTLAKSSDETMITYTVGMPVVNPNVTYKDYVVTPDNRSWIGYTTGTTQRLFIPPVFTYGGVNYKTVGIGENAFFGEDNLQEVYIPETVTAISFYAFAGTSIDYATIRSDVQTIANSAFEGCLNLQTINMVKDINSIPGAPWGAPNDPDVYWFGDGMYLTAIEITTPPDKTDYIEGEKFNSTGMVVTAYYQNGTSKVITNWELTDNNKLKVGQTKVTIKYTENGRSRTASQQINVTNPLVKISVKTKPTTKTYEYGSTLDLTGLTIQAQYQNGTTQIVQGWELVGSTYLNKIGNNTFYVNYSENGVTKSTSFKIIVTNPMQKLEIATYPTKTEYYTSEVIDTSGLTLKATFKDGSTSIIGPSVCDITPTSDTLLTINNTSMTISYTDAYGVTLTQSVDIDVYHALSYFEYSGSKVTGLSSIYYRDLPTTLKVPPKFTVLAADCFAGDTNLVVVKLSDSTKTINQGAFSGCTSLKSVSLGGVTYIGHYAFENCGQLGTVVVPESTTYIATTAFNGTSANLVVKHRSGEISGAPWGTSGTITYTVN